MAKILAFRDFVNENYAGGIGIGDGESFLPELAGTPEIPDSNDDDTTGLADQIEPGDFVDFGQYGKLYVCAHQGRDLWVSDDEADRFNPDAQGWLVKASSATAIIERGGDGNDDGEGISDEDDFEDAGNGDGVDRDLPSNEVPSWAK